MAKRKPGKYDHLLPKLPKLPPEDLEYQQRVEDVKKRIRFCEHCNGKGKQMVPLSATEEQTTCHFCNGNGRRKLNGQSLADLYVIARADVETVAKAMSDANLILEAVSQMLIASQDSGDSDWGAFGASDRGLRLTNGDAIRTQPEIYPVAKDKAAFREWCFANGLRNRMDLPPKPMTDLAKSRLLHGESEPTGMTIYVRTKIVYTPLKTSEVSAQNNDESTEETIF
jgi:hypothetical protein